MFKINLHFTKTVSSFKVKSIETMRVLNTLKDFIGGLRVAMPLSFRYLGTRQVYTLHTYNIYNFSENYKPNYKTNSSPRKNVKIRATYMLSNGMTTRVSQRF